jgi:hypothetical protein
MIPTNLVFPVLSPDEAIAIADQGDWSEWITIPHTPIGALRQSRNSHWAGTDAAVARMQLYHDYGKFIRWHLGAILDLPNLQERMTQIDAVFFMPLPKGCYTPKGALSAQGKQRINQPHMFTPDTDNLVKGLVDGIFKNSDVDDSQIWDMRGLKFWAVEGSVSFRWK